MCVCVCVCVCVNKIKNKQQASKFYNKITLRSSYKYIIKRSQMLNLHDIEIRR